jgi:hypothetical protein
VQQARNLAGEIGACMESLRFLRVTATASMAVFEAGELHVIATAPRAPRMNAHCERIIGSILCRSKSHRCTSCGIAVLVDESAVDPGALQSAGLEVVHGGGLFLSLRAGATPCGHPQLLVAQPGRALVRLPDRPVPAPRCAQSVVALEKGVRAWIESWTADSKPFVWRETARRSLTPSHDTSHEFQAREVTSSTPAWSAGEDRFRVHTGHKGFLIRSLRRG